MITIKHSGNFNKLESFLYNSKKLNFQRVLESYGKQGVLALASATPKDTGITSDSWDYFVSSNKDGYSVSWTNSNVNNGIPIVILIQYGHGTGNGGYVQGRDFINPAIRPIFDKLSKALWAEVSKL